MAPKISSKKIPRSQRDAAQLQKLLLIIRHAHRDKIRGADFDNGISKKGEKQANFVRKLCKDLCASHGKSIRFFSSPKKRCIQTVQPLAKSARKKVEIVESLNECATFAELREKILAVKALWLASDATLTVVCSHGDVIPVLLAELVMQRIDLDKGGVALVEREHGSNRLSILVQSPAQLL